LGCGGFTDKKTGHLRNPVSRLSLKNRGLPALLATGVAFLPWL
jgi:hypothetical protein